MGGSGKTFDKDGQTFEVRFFDSNSFFDLRDLREIVQSPGVQSWMTSVRNMSHKHYGKWMNEKGEGNQFLFAIAGEDADRQGIQRIHGFIYIYPSDLMPNALEVSYAKRPAGPKGLITPGLRVASEMVKERLGREPRIVAEIERGNTASIVAIERAGFVKTKDFDRTGNGIWTLDWTKLGIV